MPTTDNFERFMSVYEQKLTAAVKDHNDEYAYPVSEVPGVVARMRAAFLRQSYNKDGRAIRDTCKELGIKYTYVAINAYLGVKE